MAVVQKTLGIIILLIGGALMIAGASAAVYGYMDAQEHQEEQGPLGLGEDEERAQTNDALVVGGIVAAGLGVAAGIIGIVLLAASRPRQHQQQSTVIATAGSGAWEPAGMQAGTVMAAGTAMPRDREAAPRRNVAIVAGVAAMLLPVSLGLVLAGGGANPLGNDPGGSGALGQMSYDGQLLLAGSALGTAPRTHVAEYSAANQTGAVRAHVDWEPADDQSLRLQATIQVAQGAGWRDLATKTVAPGDFVEARAPGGGLDGARVRIVVAPVDGTFVIDQAFTVVVAFLR